MVRLRTIMRDCVLDENKAVNWNLMVMRKEAQAAFSSFAGKRLPNDLSETENRMIGYICRHQGCLSVDIANAFHLTKSTVSEFVNSLANNGYVRFEECEDDKRKVKLMPTEKSVKLSEEIEALISEFDANLEKGLSKEEKVLLVKIYRKMEKNIKEEM